MTSETSSRGRQVHVLHGLEGLGSRLVAGAEGNMGLERLADALVRTGLLQHAIDVAAQGDERIPAAMAAASSA